jgi:hypothetical protein
VVVTKTEFKCLREQKDKKGDLKMESKAIVLEKFYQEGTSGNQVLAKIGSKYVVQWGLNDGSNWDDIVSGYSYDVFNTLEEATIEYNLRKNTYRDVR